MVLYGKNSILERLKVNPKSIKKILIEDNFNVPEIEMLIETSNICVERLSTTKLIKIKNSENLQGIIAKVDDFKYTPFNDLLYGGQGVQNESLNLLFLDRICDPQNLGAIIRIAACFGGFAIIIPKFEACGVNETVLHVASGGENYVLISKVSNLSNAIISAKKKGYWIIGTEVSNNAKNINEILLPFPAGIVLGSEGKGIRKGIQKHIDISLHIPMARANFSFNVASVCAIFCYELTKQKRSSLQ